VRFRCRRVGSPAMPLPTRILVGLAVAGAAFALLAPLRCRPAIEVLETGPGITVDRPTAGEVTCDRLLLPDHRGPVEPARWPAALGAVVLGGVTASALPASAREAGPPRPGETEEDR